MDPSTASPDLLSLQTGPSAPAVPGTSTGTDLLLPPEQTMQRLAHFSEEVFDLSPESHLAKLMRVLLGDAGVGMLRQRLLYARLSSTMAGSHFYDLDKFYGALFGVRRLSEEVLDFDPYDGVATPEDWDTQHGKDASYRARIEQLSEAIALGATTEGIRKVAEALLSVECEVYETWIYADDSTNTYAQTETMTYAQMEAKTYAELQGTTFGSVGETTNRSEIIVVPKRPITLEEAYSLTKVLNRVKPADSLVTIDDQGVAMHTPVVLRGLYADSEYWDVRARVNKRQGKKDAYPDDSDDPNPQPRPAFSSYQGEAWSYNADLAGVTAYVESEPNVVTSSLNAQRVTYADGERVYDATKASMPLRTLLSGRAVSDGVLASSPLGGRRG